MIPPYVTQQQQLPASQIGFSFSPGGLLLPYHLGVIDALKHYSTTTTTFSRKTRNDINSNNNNTESSLVLPPSSSSSSSSVLLTSSTPLAGSSAGAIAVVCAACELNSLQVLDATIDVSDTCLASKNQSARGKLLPLLRIKLNEMIQNEQYEIVKNRHGAIYIVYKELFPKYQSIYQHTFCNRYDLIDSVCYSSMFPFFATNYPFAIDFYQHETDETVQSSSSLSRIQLPKLPRILVDGFFAVPREQFGCVDIATIESSLSLEKSITTKTKISNTKNDDETNTMEDSAAIVTRTTSGSIRSTRCPTIITIPVSVFPKSISKINNPLCICPNEDDDMDPYEKQQQVLHLFRLATKPSSRYELTTIYENGWTDTERWLRTNQEYLLSTMLSSTTLDLN